MNLCIAYKLFFLFLLSLGYLHQSTEAVDLELSSQIDIRMSYGLHPDRSEWVERKIRFQSGMEADLLSAGEVHFSVLGFYDDYYRETKNFTNSSIKQRHDTQVQNAYWLYEADLFLFMLGKQQVTWGESDYFRVIDVVNPLDLSDYLLSYLDEPSFAKQSLTMLNLEVYGEVWTYQWLWVWQFKETLLPSSGSNFSSPVLESIFEIQKNMAKDRPDDFSIKDSSFGVKFSRGFDWSDFSLYAWHGWNSDPILTSEIRWFRRNMLGLSISFPLDAWIIRTDASVWLNEAIGYEGVDVVEKNRYNFLIGADYNAESYSLSIQGYQNWVLHQSEAKKALQIPDSEISLSLYADYKFLSDDLVVSCLVLHSLKTDVGMGQFSTDYRVQENIVLSLAVDIFHGEDTHIAIFGGYQEQNRLTFKIGYYFD